MYLLIMRKYIIILVMSLACFPLKAKTYVVIAGIADYPGTNIDLLFEDNDAQVMRKLYRAVDSTNVVITLTDSLATTKMMLHYMNKEFVHKAKENDIIVFYFSGHGYPGGFLCYDDYLQYDTIVSIMKESKAKKKILFADACYSGKIRTPQKRTAKKFGHDIMFFLSSRTDETSLQTTSKKNSYFTAYLVNGLKGKADADRDRKVTARELYNYVHNRVADGVDYLESLRVDEHTKPLKQHPVMWGNFDDDMVVIDWSQKSKN